MNQNELYHHGVLGMRWGHKKNTINTSKDGFVLKKEHKFIELPIIQTKNKPGTHTHHSKIKMPLGMPNDKKCSAKEKPHMI